MKSLGVLLQHGKVPVGDVGIYAPAPEAWLLILLGLMILWRLDTRSSS